MSAPRVDQLYATHCTFGSEATERAVGDGADDAFGYGVRATSKAGRKETERMYKSVSKHVYYHMPSDAPPEAKIEWTAQRAFKRLVYSPLNANDYFVGQICYRQFDAVNETPGSYFGHILLAQPAENASSVLQSLNLWNAPGWVIEDSPQLNHDLTTLSSTQELLGESKPFIDDQRLVEFLSREELAEWVPFRWRKMKLSLRRDYVRLVLSAALRSLETRLERVLVYVEPEIAVVLFFAAARLLPSRLRDSLSFSTHEAEGGRPLTKLSATAPYAGEPKVESNAREGRRSVINTYSRMFKVKPSKYAIRIVDVLLDGGMSEVDRILEIGDQLIGGGAKESAVAATEDSVDLDEFCCNVITGAGPADRKRAERLRNYFAACEGRRQKTQSDARTEAELPSLRASLETHLLRSPDSIESIARSNSRRTVVLSLLTSKEMRDHVMKIIQAAPAGDTVQIVNEPGPPPSFKAYALKYHLAKRSTSLPQACSQIWHAMLDATEQAVQDPMRAMHNKVGQTFLDMLNKEQFAKLADDAHDRPLALAAMAARGGFKPVEAIQHWISPATSRLQDDGFLRFLELAQPLVGLQDYQVQTVVGERILQLMHELIQFPYQFDVRIKCLAFGRFYVDGDADLNDLMLWSNFYAKLLAFRQQPWSDDGAGEVAKLLPGRQILVADSLGEDEGRFDQAVAFLEVLLRSERQATEVPVDIQPSLRGHLQYGLWGPPRPVRGGESVNLSGDKRRSSKALPTPVIMGIAVSAMVLVLAVLVFSIIQQLSQ